MRLNDWNTNPIFSCRIWAYSESFVDCLRILLKILTFPLDGVSIVPMILSYEDFPPPEVPKISTNSPRWIDIEIPRTAVIPSIPRR